MDSVESNSGQSSDEKESSTPPCPSCRQIMCSCKSSPGGLGGPAASLLNYPRILYHPNNGYDQQVAYLAAAAAAAAAAEHSALYSAAVASSLPPSEAGSHHHPSAGASGGKELSNIGSWGSAHPSPYSVYHPYSDPSFAAAAAAAAAAAYPFNGYSVDVNGSRRKNATRETTSTLKAWLNEHKKNPYPTKGEKIMLAIITKMTLTQVSTWFANARRRLKKENKMTWEPRNRPDDDDDVDVSDQDESEVERKKEVEEDDRLHRNSTSEREGKAETTAEKTTSKPRIWSLADLAGNNSSSPLPGSAFSPLNRSNSEVYRGLYPHYYPPDNP